MKHLETMEDKIVGVISNIILVIIAFLAIYPLWFVVMASISDPNMVMNGQMWFIPKGINFAGYMKVIENDRIWMGYGNSILYTVVATVLNIAVTMAAAFAVSRKDLPGKGGIMTFFMITMFFGGGTVPTYLLMKNLHLLDNRLVMIIPGLISVWNLVIARTNIQSSIPDELIEAATIDGCSYFKCFTRIVLPLSKAIMAVLALYYGVGHWNAYMGALIYLSDDKKYPLQLILREILIQTQMTNELMADSATAQKAMQEAEIMKYSVVIVASIPVLMLYPFLQKYFVKGVMVGAIKG